MLQLYQPDIIPLTLFMNQSHQSLLEEINRSVKMKPLRQKKLEITYYQIAVYKAIASSQLTIMQGES